MNSDWYSSTSKKKKLGVAEFVNSKNSGDKSVGDVLPSQSIIILSGCNILIL